MKEEEKQVRWAIGNEELVPVYEACDQLSKVRSPFGSLGGNTITYRMLSRMYRMLDGYTGRTSYIRFNRQEALLTPYYKILGELYEAGVIEKWALERRSENGAPSFWGLDILPKIVPGTTDGNPMPKWIGHAVGKDIENVYSRAIGEFFERYLLLLYKQKDLVRGSLADLRSKKEQVFPLERLVSFSNAQKKKKPRSRWDEKSIFSFTRTVRYSTGENILTPAQLVFWNYAVREEEPFLGEGNTNGAGGYFTKEGALLSGLYELIQRDAFLIFWLNKLAPPRIDPDTVPNDRFQNLLEECRRLHFQVHVLDTSLDTGIPSVAVVIEDQTGKTSRFSVGAGCERDGAKAIAKGLEEAWGVYYWTRMLPYYTLPEGYEPFDESNVGVGQNERLALWANPAMAKEFAFLIAGEKKPFSSLRVLPTFPSVKEELAYVIRQVEELGRGYEVYTYLPDHPLLKKYGYVSAKVIVPQLMPLYLYERNALLGGNRLREVPKKFGYEPAHMLNPLPHPFP